MLKRLNGLATINIMKWRYFSLVISILLASLFADPAGYAETIDLVPSGATWTYLDDGSDQETAWQAYSFDDSTWATGPAELGYGDGGETTVVSYGADPNNKYITTYFRKTFSVSDPSVYKYLKLRLLRDDGAVVYINGIEAVRSNMPDTSITYQTVASGVVGGDDESRYFEYFLEPDDLTAGESNVIAVEIHQANATSSDISVDLELTASTSACLIKGPYLIYPGDNTEMDVHWQLTDVDTSKIEWGLDTTYSGESITTSEYGSYHQHKHTITGLTPGTKYYYRVSSNAEDQDHQRTGSFVTAPEEQAEQVKFLVYGDTRSFPEDHDTVAAGMLSLISSESSYQTMLLAAGDMVSEGRNESSWTNEFFDPTYLNIQEVLANISYQSCVGNHELDGSDGDLYDAYFPYPYVSGYYWSFDYGPMHVSVVDQYTDYSAGSAQLTWLEADLATTDKPWKILLFHEPGWSSGGGHVNNTDVQNLIQPLCEQYGVSIIFSGHNHYYARAKVNGVQHITTGGGGAPLQTPETGFPYVKTTASVHHYCKVDISKNILTFEAVEPDGTVVDTFKINLVAMSPVLFLLLN